MGSGVMRGVPTRVRFKQLCLIPEHVRVYTVYDYGKHNFDAARFAGFDKMSSSKAL